jgi:hypothetical protein
VFLDQDVYAIAGLLELTGGEVQLLTGADIQNLGDR